MADEATDTNPQPVLEGLWEDTLEPLQSGALEGAGRQPIDRKGPDRGASASVRPQTRLAQPDTGAAKRAGRRGERRATHSGIDEKQLLRHVIERASRHDVMILHQPERDIDLPRLWRRIRFLLLARTARDCQMERTRGVVDRREESTSTVWCPECHRAPARPQSSTAAVWAVMSAGRSWMTVRPSCIDARRLCSTTARVPPPNVPRSRPNVGSPSRAASSASTITSPPPVSSKKTARVPAVERHLEERQGIGLKESHHGAIPIDSSKARHCQSWRACARGPRGPPSQTSAPPPRNDRLGREPPRARPRVPRSTRGVCSIARVSIAVADGTSFRHSATVPRTRRAPTNVGAVGADPLPSHRPGRTGPLATLCARAEAPRALRSAGPTGVPTHRRAPSAPPPMSG